MCIGGITGDIIGSIYEGMHRNPRRKSFPLFNRRNHFTDDTVLMVATMDVLLNYSSKTYTTTYKDYFKRYPHAGYGKAFKAWAGSETRESYGSWGNGSGMRVSPVAWMFDTKEKVLEEAERSACVTHSHPEGIKGAKAIALAVYLARKGMNKYGIKKEIIEQTGYDLDVGVLTEWDVSCKGCVPQALIAFFDSSGFEDAIRKAVLRGGDSDTIAAMTGSIAEAYYGIPEHITAEVFSRLPKDLADITEEFTRKYIDPSFKVPPPVDHSWRAIFKWLTL